MLTSIARLSQALGTTRGTTVPTRCSAETVAVPLSQLTDISIQTSGPQVRSPYLASPFPARAFSLTFFALKAWTNVYPVSPPGVPVDPNAMPQFWKNFIQTAIKDGKIPDIPVATMNPTTGVPEYPNAYDPASLEVCSGDEQCRILGNIWDAPDGEIALAFDDGPTDVSRVSRSQTQIFVSPAVVLSICQDETRGQIEHGCI